MVIWCFCNFANSVRTLISQGPGIWTNNVFNLISKMNQGKIFGMQFRKINLNPSLIKCYTYCIPSLMLYILSQNAILCHFVSLTQQITKWYSIQQSILHVALKNKMFTNDQQNPAKTPPERGTVIFSRLIQ